MAWQPWGPAALATARTLDRPLLLVLASEGCLPFEQMAAESFAEAATAAVMNEGYVCVLADARWHPELDRQLQLVHQLLAGRSGGWPLLAMIDPVDARPCFAGTYLPAAPTGPLPGFADFLRQALGHFRRQRPALQEQGERLARAFQQMVPPALSADLPLNATPLALVRRQLEALFDRDTGAFGRGQPVPPAAAATRLLRHWAAGAATPEPDLQALFMATLALTRAASAPASTSAKQLSGEIAAFAAASAGTGEPAFRECAEGHFAALAALGEPAAAALPAAEDWHRLRAMAVAARWLDRPEWSDLVLTQQAAARARHDVRVNHSRGTTAAALAATLAALELHWSGGAFEFANALAEAWCETMASTPEQPSQSTTAMAALPGLPGAPEHADDALPSPEGTAAIALFRLGCLCGNAHWRAAAASVLRRAWRPLNDTPSTHLALLDGLEEQTLGLETIIIRGEATDAARWARALGRWYAPARQVYAIPNGAFGLPAHLANLGGADRATQAWVFTGDELPTPSDSLEQLTRELRDRLHRD